MTYVQHLIELPRPEEGNTTVTLQRNPLLLVIEDDGLMTAALSPICDFLDVGLERLPSESDLAEVLRSCRPMAVLAQLDCQAQDGCHVMMTIARFDKTVPLLLVLGDDPALAGAADAVEELWDLDAVTKVASLPSTGGIVDFLFRAGRKAQCVRFMPV